MCHSLLLSRYFFSQPVSKYSGNRSSLIITALIIWNPPVGTGDLLHYIIIMTGSRFLFQIGKWNGLSSSAVSFHGNTANKWAAEMRPGGGVLQMKSDVAEFRLCCGMLPYLNWGAETARWARNETQWASWARLGLRCNQCSDDLNKNLLRHVDMQQAN